MTANLLRAKQPRRCSLDKRLRCLRTPFQGNKSKLIPAGPRLELDFGNLIPQTKILELRKCLANSNLSVSASQCRHGHTEVQIEKTHVGRDIIKTLNNKLNIYIHMTPRAFNYIYVCICMYMHKYKY